MSDQVQMATETPSVDEAAKPLHVILVSPQADAFVMLKNHAIAFPSVDVVCFVGEGKPEKYIPVFQQFFAVNRPDQHVPVYQSLPSDENFELFESGDLARDSEETIADNMGILRVADRIISVKPLRELLDPVRFSLKGKVLHLYGSHNFRTVNATSDEVNALSNRYEKVLIVESFNALGKCNSLLFEPKLEADGNLNAEDEFIRGVIFKSNTIRVNECKKKIELYKLKDAPTEQDTVKYQRQLDILGKIEPNVPSQIAAANACMFILPDPDYPVRVAAFDANGFSSYVHDPDSNMFVYKIQPEDQALRLQSVQEALRA